MTAEQVGEYSAVLVPRGRSLIPPAQMKTSMPIAKAMLKDIKPPIADNAIADSLWHYYFDVEKAVTWLRKDWEKKGEQSSSLHHLPSTFYPGRGSNASGHTAPRPHPIILSRASAD